MLASRGQLQPWSVSSQAHHGIAPRKGLQQVTPMLLAHFRVWNVQCGSLICAVQVVGIAGCIGVLTEVLTEISTTLASQSSGAPQLSAAPTTLQICRSHSTDADSDADS